MILRKTGWVLFLLLILSFAAVAQIPLNSEEKIPENAKPDNWKADNICNGPVKIGLSADIPAGKRFLLLMDEEFFTEDKLREFFTCFDKEYRSKDYRDPEAVYLGVEAYSDKRNLEVAIRNFFSPPWDIDYAINRSIHNNTLVNMTEKDCKNIKTPDYLKTVTRPCLVDYPHADYFSLNGDSKGKFSFYPNPKGDRMTVIDLNEQK
jgi:hypothetical protein